ncbi:uncharacterized protein LOC129778291 [Toxorhynchites rutilus septentrionalis]|uniref:uncharacterized protein LOC129778291 n=1 Tax=Toxorhynchites rutilus septentrionalis TaxID=329112 RepID=UPI002479BE68|nr:uncharacterized protein LOC129778291 [Toxorhynchites rutilus septentrionalis]
MSRNTGDHRKVERILQWTVVQGWPYVLIKWKDCDDSENSWVPAERVTGSMNYFQTSSTASRRKRTTEKKRSGIVEKVEDTHEHLSANPGTSYRMNDRLVLDGLEEAMANEQKSDDDERNTDTVEESTDTGSEMEEACAIVPFNPYTTQRENEGFALHGFQKGYRAKRIERLVEENGDIYLLIKWKGIEAPEWVSSAIARWHITDMLIDYYEQLIMWRGKV